MNWKSPGAILAGVPATVQFVSGKERSVLESTVNDRAGLALLKANRKEPFSRNVVPNKIVGVTPAAWEMAMVRPSTVILAARVAPVSLAVNEKVTMPFEVPVMVSQG